MNAPGKIASGATGGTQPERQPASPALSAAEVRFAARALRRKKLFLGLSIASVVMGAGLLAFYTWRLLTDPGYPVAIHFVIVVLVLLNGRQNLRQYRYACLLEKVIPSP